MTDETSAPAGGEAMAVITPAPDTGEELSIAEAARAYVGAKVRKPDESTAESADEATADPELPDDGNADPETAPSEEPDEAEPEEKLPPIDPPRSWTQAEKERFQSLPRETQEYLHTREQERETALRRSQNEIAEQRNAIKAEREAAEKVRQQYEAQLPTLKQAMLRAQSEAFPDIKTWDDVKTLQRTDPFRYQEWDVHQKELALVDAQEKEAATRQAQEKQGKRTAYEAEQNKLLTELVPEMADPKKANELRTRAVAMLTDDLGLKTDQLSRWMQDDTGHEILSNAGIQKLIADGLKFRDIQNAPKAVVKPNLPPVQRPGTAKPSGSAISEQIQALTRKLEQTGDMRVATELYQLEQRAARRAS